MRLITLKPNLSKSAKNFIKKVVTTLVKQMQNNFTIAPKVPKYNYLRKSNAVDNPKREIACFGKFMYRLFYTPPKMALYTWPKNFFQLDKNEVKNSMCFNLSPSLFTPRYLRIARLSKGQFNFFKKLLTFGTQTCNKKDGVRTPRFDIHINFHKEADPRETKEADPQGNTVISILDGVKKEGLDAIYDSTVLI